MLRLAALSFCREGLAVVFALPLSWTWVPPIDFLKSEMHSNRRGAIRPWIHSIVKSGKGFQYILCIWPAGVGLVAADGAIAEDQHAFRKLRNVMLMGDQHNR